MDDNDAPGIQTGPLLTRDEVADKLHLTPDTAGQLIPRTGMGIYLCRRTYIYERDLNAYLSALRGKSGE